MTIHEILEQIEYTVIIDGVEKQGNIVFSTWIENITKQSEKASGYEPEKMFDPVARDNFQKYIALAYYAGLLPAKVIETRTNEIKNGCYVFTVETVGTLVPNTEPQEPEQKEEENTGLYNQMTAELENLNDRSAWNKGVNAYALELVENLKEYAEFQGRNPQPGKECREWLLNGAQDWEQYSWGGSSLIYDYDIAERLCTPSELKKNRNGERRPNNREEWLDVQARALYQACNRVSRLYSRIAKEVLK